MEKKGWCPCFCTILLGVLVIVFTWWHLSWSQWALTVLGGLVVLKGLIGACCCKDKMLICCGGEHHKSGE
jgi:hypothetical protein